MMLTGCRNTLMVAIPKVYKAALYANICFIYGMMPAFLQVLLGWAAFLHFKHPLCTFQEVTQGLDANSGLLKEIKADDSKGERNRIQNCKLYRTCGNQDPAHTMNRGISGVFKWITVMGTGV